MISLSATVKVTVIVLAFTFGGKLINMIAKIRAILFPPNMGIRRVPLVKQEVLILSEHLNTPPVFSAVRVTRSFVLCVRFVDRCVSFCPFSFGHCVVWPSINGF